MPIIKQLEIKKNQRVLITSDIHGNLERFKQMLQRVQFNTDDVLIINGDLTEKGTASLETVRYTYELSKTHEIHIIQGNCETLQYLDNPEHFEMLRNYINNRPQSLIHEMLVAIGVTITPDMNMHEARTLLKLHYPEYIDFLGALPNIIETDVFTLVHAGLEQKSLADQDVDLIQTMPYFGLVDAEFDKPVIVGHYPVCLYHNQTIDHKPILDVIKNIYSIDGGNVIKDDGQLNVLIYEQGHFTVDYVDGFDYYSILNHQDGNNGTHISWMDREVEILDKKPEFIRVKQRSTGNEAWIHESFVDEVKSEVIDDVTDTVLQLSKHDLFHPLLKTSTGYYGKHNGEVGWYFGALGEYCETH